MTTIALVSTLTCPACGHSRAMTMEEDSCQIRCVCPGCGVAIRPEPGDCCVFCSYGSVPCPPIQRERAGTSEMDAER